MGQVLFCVLGWLVLRVWHLAIFLCNSFWVS